MMIPRFGATLKKVIALTVLCSLSLYGSVSQFRSPVSLEYNYGRFGYQLPQINDDCWNLRIFGGGYERCADKAFCEEDCVCPETCSTKTDRSGVTTSTKNLAKLFFGKTSFKPEEIFTNATLCGRNCGNPWLVFSTLNPCLKFSEKGVVLGLDLRRNLGCKCDRNYYAGIRAELPVRVVEVNHFRGCDLEVKDALDLLCSHIQAQDLNADPTLFAFQVQGTLGRLDFLSQLQRTSGEAFIQYGNGSLIIAGQESALASLTENPVAAVLQQDNGTCSNQDIIFPSVTNTASPIFPIVNGDGTGLDNDQVGKFQNNQDYRQLQTNCDQQGQLYIAPVLLDTLNPPAGAAFTSESIQIQNELNNILLQLQTSGRDNALAFFREKGVNFCKDERVVGPGNLAFDLYAGCETDCYYHDIMIGFRLPTDKTNKDPERLYLLSTGNNGHGEFKIGLEGGWYPHYYWVFNWNVSYNHVFDTCERRAAAFKCSTVKNIGPSTPAEIGWSYWVAQLNWNLFHPDCPTTGLTLGGELFAKKDDNVRFLCQSAIRDFCDDLADMDPSLLEDNTNTLSLKVHGEMFHRHNCWEFFAGASHIFAGRFAAKESEWHLGMNVYF